MQMAHTRDTSQQCQGLTSSTGVPARVLGVGCRIDPAAEVPVVPQGALMEAVFRDVAGCTRPRSHDTRSCCRPHSHVASRRTLFEQPAALFVSAWRGGAQARLREDVAAAHSALKAAQPTRRGTQREGSATPQEQKGRGSRLAYRLQRTFRSRIWLQWQCPTKGPACTVHQRQHTERRARRLETSRRKCWSDCSDSSANCSASLSCNTAASTTPRSHWSFLAAN